MRLWNFYIKAPKKACFNFGFYLYACMSLSIGFTPSYLTDKKCKNSDKIMFHLFVSLMTGCSERLWCYNYCQCFVVYDGW